MRRLSVLVVGLLVVAFAVAVSAQAQGTASATATIIDLQGFSHGTVTFTQQSDGVLVQLNLGGFAPTSQNTNHGFHVHENGVCTVGDFSSAGRHWNPTVKQHGMLNPQGFHQGDMPNVQFFRNGSSDVRFTVNHFTVDQIVGKAVVLHAGADDLMTDPSGNSGPPIGCGVVVRQGGGTPAQPTTAPTAPAQPTAVPPAQPTAVPPAQPTAVPPAQPTTVPAAPAVKPVITAPTTNFNCYVDPGGCTFGWTYGGTLAPNQYFQVQAFVLNSNQAGRGLHAPTKSMSVSLNGATTFQLLRDICDAELFCGVNIRVAVVEWDGADPSRIGTVVALSDPIYVEF